MGNTSIINQIIIVVIVLLLFLALIYPVKKEELNTESFLSIKNSNNLKAISAIMVVLCHATNKSLQSGLISIFANMGFLAVGVFFLISGYGLAYNYFNKANYLHGFIKKRIIGLCLPFWCVNIIYILASGKQLGTVDLLKYVLGIKLICGDLWFIRRIAILYLIFWIVCKLVKDKKKAIMTIIVIVVLENIFFILYLRYLGQMIPFAIGLLIGMLSHYFLREKNDMELTVKRLLSNRIFLLFALTIFVITYFYVSIVVWHIDLGLLVFILTGELCQNVFVISAFLLAIRLSFGKKILSQIGKYSYGIYLIQGLIVDKMLVFNEKSPLLYITAVLMVCIIVGVLFGYLVKLITDAIFYRKRLKE